MENNVRVRNNPDQRHEEVLQHGPPNNFQFIYNMRKTTNPDTNDITTNTTVIFTCPELSHIGVVVAMASTLMLGYVAAKRI